jgi:outer membrane protein OmpA-like peptidoglycan-associated protein
MPGTRFEQRREGWLTMQSGPSRFPRRALPVLFALALGGCSVSDLDVLGLFDEDPPTAQTAGSEDVRERGDYEREAAESSNTPSLTSVPSRPPAGSPGVRDRVVEGLISDRNNARYTDEAIRLQGSTRAPDASQQAARTPPEPPQVTPPSPAPTPSVTVTAPPPAPATPPQTASAPPPAPVTAPPAPARPVSAPPPAPTRSGPEPSVVVDTSAINGGGYVPVSAQISREAQVATIQFAHSSASLDARDRQVIAQVASAQRAGGEGVLVVGHASSRTRQLSKARHEVANFDVSFARANVVAQELIRAGVPADRVTVEAVADGQPIYSEAMPNGEAGNRRAEIFFLR